MDRRCPKCGSTHIGETKDQIRLYICKDCRSTGIFKKTEVE